MEATKIYEFESEFWAFQIFWACRGIFTSKKNIYCPLFWPDMGCTSGNLLWRNTWCMCWGFKPTSPWCWSQLQIPQATQWGQGPCWCGIWAGLPRWDCSRVWGSLEWNSSALCREWPEQTLQEKENGWPHIVITCNFKLSSLATWFIYTTNWLMALPIWVWVWAMWCGHCTEVSVHISHHSASQNFTRTGSWWHVFGCGQ